MGIIEYCKCKEPKTLPWTIGGRDDCTNCGKRIQDNVNPNLINKSTSF